MALADSLLFRQVICDITNSSEPYFWASLRTIVTLWYGITYCYGKSPNLSCVEINDLSMAIFIMFNSKLLVYQFFYLFFLMIKGIHLFSAI